MNNNNIIFDRIETTVVCYDMFLNDFHQLNIQDFNNLDENEKFHNIMTEYLFNNEYDYFYYLFDTCLKSRQYIEKAMEYKLILYIVNNLNFMMNEKKELKLKKAHIIKKYYKNLFADKYKYFNKFITILLTYIVESTNNSLLKPAEKYHYTKIVELFISNINAAFTNKERRIMIQTLGLAKRKNKRIFNNIHYFITEIQKKNYAIKFRYNDIRGGDGL